MTNLVPIRDLVDKVSTWNPAQSNSISTFKYIDLGTLDQSSKEITGAFDVLTKDAPSRARQLVKSGDILVSTVRPNLNGVAVVPEELDGATASTGFCVLRPTSAIDGSYLFHWVRSPEFVTDMTRKATGQSYPAVSDKIIKESRIPLPKLSDQQRISETLGEVAMLRAKRREAITLLGEFTQSIFHDMFGDLAANAKGWDDSLSLGDVADVNSGITKGRKVSGTLRPIPYMAVLNVQDKNLDLTTVKEIEATEDEIQRYRLLKDDLLLTEGGDPDKLGRGTLWQNELPEAIHQNHIFRVRLHPSSKVEPNFLNWLIASERGRRYFLRSAKQTTGIASINATQLRQFPLVIPPLALQNEFAVRLGKIKTHESTQRAHLAELDALFASLQQRAFRGGLWDDRGN
ncbi:restriction endonuclease subunit S [Sphaerimonospora cavernae]|uniref:Restriction endonuclease subunit S n=1 Tax=Sphaerimonospora cavernae TaxID=1740611 RepID=A0ABV6U276_9ACTN